MGRKITISNFEGKNKEVFTSCVKGVLEQLSEGLWRRKRRSPEYFAYADVNNSGDIVIYDEIFKTEKTEEVLPNPYKEMTDKEVISYFAKKISELITKELELEGKDRSHYEGDEYLVLLGCHYSEAEEIVKTLQTLQE